MHFVGQNLFTCAAQGAVFDINGGDPRAGDAERDKGCLAANQVILILVFYHYRAGLFAQLASCAVLFHHISGLFDYYCLKTVIALFYNFLNLTSGEDCNTVMPGNF